MMKNKYRKIEVDGVLYHWRIELPFDYDMDMSLKINIDKKVFMEIPLINISNKIAITPYIVRLCIRKDIKEISYDMLEHIHINNTRRKKIISLKEELKNETD